jgi:DNA-binding NarL/FixJ family response regulator
VRKIIKNGALGCVLKSDEVEALVLAIRTVIQGGTWFSHRILKDLLSPNKEKQSFSKRFRLTEREVEVLQWLIAGYTNKQIASTIYISEKTVEKHIGELLKKVGVESRLEVAVQAVREGII